MAGSLLANFDIDNKKNFWKLYPSMKTPKEYKKLYDGDKDKSKNMSSDLMWGIIHIFDKSEFNPYRFMDLGDRKEVVADDVLGRLNFDWDKLKDQLEFAEKSFYTEEERSLYSLEEYAEKRRRYIQEQQDDLNLDLIKDIDAAIKRNQSVFDEINRLRDIVELKETSGKTKGDITESAIEKGDI